MDILKSKPTNIKKKEIVACLNCRKNHKKCDGKRPCFLCIRNKTECVEFEKRKAIGRPSKSLKLAEEENTKKFKNGIILHGINMTCSRCKIVMDVGSNFCINCGINVRSGSGSENERLMTELTKLREMNSQLMNIIQINQFKTSEIWMMIKIEYPKPGELIRYPISSYVNHVTPLFSNLLGYNNLNNQYYPDLLPKIHHQMVDFKKANINIELVDGLSTPKMVFVDHIFLRHKEGYYVKIATETSTYFDNETGVPSFCILKVNQISCLRVEEKSLPPRIFPVDFNFYGNHNVPEFIKQNKNYAPYQFNPCLTFNDNDHLDDLFDNLFNN